MKKQPITIEIRFISTNSRWFITFLRKGKCIFESSNTYANPKNAEQTLKHFIFGLTEQDYVIRRIRQ